MGRIKLPKNRTTAITFAVAILVSLVICGELHSLWSKRPPTGNPKRYLVARRAVSPGLGISFFDFELVRRDPASTVPRGGITDQELHFIQGAILTRPLSRGELLTWEMVERPKKKNPKPTPKVEVWNDEG